MTKNNPSGQRCLKPLPKGKLAKEFFGVDSSSHLSGMNWSGFLKYFSILDVIWV